jgi:hypothetical protein
MNSIRDWRKYLGLIIAIEDTHTIANLKIQVEGNGILFVLVCQLKQETGFVIVPY